MAIGDALGMPSQTLTREDIARHYGTITPFVPPCAGHPVSHGLQAGQVTDDTEQALLLAARLIDGSGQIDETLWAKDLLAWEANVRRRGLRDLLGPSSKAALDAMLSGVPASETGRNGTTNGAAMRITPVGIATSVDDLSTFLDRVELASRMTHNTGEAIAAAAAVAAVISCGIGGYGFDAAIETALKAADQGQNRGYDVGVNDMSQRILAALALAADGVSEQELADQTGTSVASHESVPAAFGVVRLAGGDPWKAALIAANIGDDTDTIGAIAGAMSGACSGIDAIRPDALATVRAANELPIETIAAGLLKQRAAVARAHPDLDGVA
jgi:ADP-ribosylglycohydrolase